MRVAVITGSLGGYDPIRPLGDSGFDDALCIMDDPAVSWQNYRPLLFLSKDHPRLACKNPKMTPWRFTDCDAAVWVDSSFEIHEGFSDWVREHLERDDFVVWDHPEDRDCIWQEMELCESWTKYAAWPLREQVESYAAEGFPKHYGLWACGVVGWRFTDSAKEFGQEWLAEQRRWSIQDQISLPYLLWKHGRVPGIWQAHELDNPYLTYHPHERYN
jgi:hypothetical protein